MDSFDHYTGTVSDIVKKYAAASGATIRTTEGRRSSGAMEVGFGQSFTTKTFTPGDATAIVGFAYRCQGSLPSGVNPICAIRSGSTSQVTLAINASGVPEVYRGTTSGTLLGTASSGIAVSTYIFIEIKVAVHASAGTVTVRLNGANVLVLTGQNTSNSGSAAWDNVQLLENAFGPSNTYFDDLYILDGSGASPLNGLLGDCRVDARYATAEGASSAWTPLSGTDNALMVDETPPDDDATYNSTPTVGATDTFVVQDAPVPGAVLHAVQLVLSQKKSDTGTCAIAPVVRHSGVDYPGTAVNVGTSYVFGVTPYGLNPGTSAAWTEADVNAAEFGYTRTA